MNTSVVVASSVVSSDILPEFVPRSSPNLRITLEDGSSFSIRESMDGRVTALYFYLYGCSPCKEICRNLNLLMGQLGARGFQAVGALINDDASYFLSGFNRLIEPVYPIGFVPRAEALAYLEAPTDERLALPRLLLIDPAGVIQRAFRAKEELYRSM
jgi:hypothetical protein